MNEYSKRKLNKHNKKYSQTYEPDQCYSLLEDLLFTSVTYLSVPQPHGKSRNCVCEISRTWKVLENEFGSGKSRKYKCKVPGKSRNLLGSDVDADAKICASAHLHSVFEQFLCYFFATCDSDEHILQYGCCYLTMYMVGNCCLSPAVPPRPQDDTVSVIVLFTIVFGCMTDCNCNL